MADDRLPSPEESVPQSTAKAADEPPLNLVEKIAAAVPFVCVLAALIAPIVSSSTDAAPTKMGKVGTVPALMFSFLMLHLAWLLGLRFRVLWSGNDLIALFMKAVCIGLWTLMIGSCIFLQR